MAVNLQKVQESERPILRNLYSLYLHDLSLFTKNIDVGEDGFFEFEDLEKCWGEDGFSPYFIKYNNSVIGFLLLLERPFLNNKNDFGINDIFILNKFKGRGMGSEAIKKLFQEKQGKYFVIELIENKPAISFWKKIYKDLNISFVERTECMDDEICLIQTFEIDRPS
ncbi:MAG TPA: GNAT family N-acetyltransferase [Bacillaceae bacterium]